MWESRATLPETWMGCRFHRVWKKSVERAGQAVVESYLQLEPVQTSFGYPTALRAGVRQILGLQKTENWRELRTVVGPRNLTSSWSPHSAQQRMSGKQKREEDKMGGDDCAEQGEATNSASCRKRVIPASATLTLTLALCHTLSCPASDTLKVKLTRIRRRSR